MLAYYQDTNDGTYLSTYDINKNIDLDIKVSEQDIYLQQNSKKLIYTMFDNFIEIIPCRKELNIISIDLHLIKNINFENTPICLDIFEDNLAILFDRGANDYYISIFNCIYESDGININEIIEINVGILNCIYNYILLMNENKILYSKKNTRDSLNLFLFNISTKEEYDLGILHNINYGVANWVNNYILFNNLHNNKIYIHNSDNGVKIYEFEYKYRICDILSTLTKILIQSNGIIKIYDKNFPSISLIGEIDIKFLIDSNFGDFDGFLDIIPSSSSDELFIIYTPFSTSISHKIIKLDLTNILEISLTLIKEFGNNVNYIKSVIYINNSLQLW